MALTSMQRTVLGYASQAARFYGVDPAIFFAQLMQENQMGWTGVGSSGEIGPGQFMAATWTGTILAHPELVQMFGAVSNPSGRSNVVANVFASAALLADMVAVTGGNYFNALARYNGGNSALGQQNGINNNYPQLVLGGVSALGTEAEMCAVLGLEAGCDPGAAGEAGGGGFDPNSYAPHTGDILQNEDGSQFTIKMDGDIIGQVVENGPSGFRQFVSLTGTFVTTSGLKVTFSNGILTGVSVLSAADAAAAGVPFATAGGGGSGALSLGEQIQLLEAQAAIARRDGDHARAEDFENQITLLKQQQEFTADQAKLQNEFNFKINRLNALDSLTSTLAQLQSANRISSIEAIGQDPLGGAIQARGGTQVGRSVFERIRKEMLNFSNAELPHVDGASASVEDINAAIQEALGLLDNDPGQLQGGAGAVIGAAHGATIRTDGSRGRRALKNTDTGQTGQGVVVGELGPELITDIGAGKFKVTPLSNTGPGPTAGTIALSGRGAGQAIAGNMRPRLLRAAHGGQFEAAHLFEEGNTQGESTLTVQSIAPLFSALGFDQVPLSRRASEAFGGVQQRPQLGSGFGGVGGITQGNTANIFQRLGTRPRLIFEPDLQLFLHIGPDGVVRSLGKDATSLEGFGINSENAQTATLADLKAMGFTVPRGPAGPFGPGSGPEFPPADVGDSELFFSNTGGTAFGELQPLRAPLNESGDIAVLLPDPRLLASVWNKLDLATQNVALSFYSKAGIQSGQLLRRMRFFRGESAGRPVTGLG